MSLVLILPGYSPKQETVLIRRLLNNTKFLVEDGVITVKVSALGCSEADAEPGPNQGMSITAMLGDLLTEVALRQYLRSNATEQKNNRTRTKHMVTPGFCSFTIVDLASISTAGAPVSIRFSEGTRGTATDRHCLVTCLTDDQKDELLKKVNKRIEDTNCTEGDVWAFAAPYA